MLGLLLIAARNLSRNWLRSVLTVLGAAVAVIAFVMLRTVVSSWEVGAEHAAKDRLGTRHKVSFVMQLPKRYVEDIRAVPGVKHATWANWFGGKDASKPDEFFATLAVDAPTFLEVTDELVLASEDKARWLTDKRGAIVGDALAKKLKLKVGDKITLQGSIYPGDWEFNVDGIYTAARKSLDRSQFLFHWSYLDDSLPVERRDTIGWVMTRVEDPSKSATISAAIDHIFDERDMQTVTMSERNMQLSFMAMFGAILTLLDVVSVIILSIMLTILGNTIAMGVRERTREYAVLRAIGFEPWHIRAFVLGEATVLGIVAGLVGIALAFPFVNNLMGRAIEENMAAWFPYFRVEPSVAVTAGAIAVPGTDEVLVGAGIRGRFAGLELGKSFEIKKNRSLSVVGVFADAGSAFESEVWAGIDTARTAFGREGYVSSVRVRLDAATKFDAFKAVNEQDRQLGLGVQRESEYYAKQSEMTADLLTIMGTVLAVLFSFGATIGATITMNAQVANRQKEIGTLRALGFSRRSILTSFLLESIVLAAIGGGVGALAALGLGFLKITMVNAGTWSEIVFSFEPTASILLRAMFLAGGMGIVGGFLPAIRASRISPIEAMRL